MATRGPLQVGANPLNGVNRVVDLGGQAAHEFLFDAPLPLVYEYFTDVPAIFSFLPDVSSVKPYGTDCCRVVVGSTDIFGFNMAGIFDLQVEFEPEQSLHIFPAEEGPAVNMRGVSFPGDLWLETFFYPQDEQSTAVEFQLELSLTIPLPGPVRKMPRPVVQRLGERAMSYKMSNMITGFVRHIEVDFARYVQWASSQ